MTVCIAAITRREEYIVAACDMMLSDDETSAEPWVTKIERLSPKQQWLGMFAGDPSVWNVVRRKATAGMDEMESLVSVKAAFEGAFRDELAHHINVEILERWGLDRETFREVGRDQFGPTRFADIAQQVEDADLHTDALIAGFEPEGAPRIFTATTNAVCVQREHLGFWAIGTGATLAMPHLYGLHDDPKGEDTVGHLIYRVCEAKFQAERASGVGRRTIVIVLKRGGTAQWLHPDRVEKIRKVWEPRSRPKVPKRGLEIIQANIQPVRYETPGGEKKD